MAIPVDCQGREYSTPVGTRVDPDAIDPLLDLRADGVAMDDHEAMGGFVRQEWLADPSKVRLTLLIERDPRPNSGVDKQIVAETAGIDECAQERGVSIGDGLANRCDRRFVAGRSDKARIRSVAFQALRSAKPKPARQVLDLAGENAQHDLLMVAEQEDRADVLAAIDPQPFYDLGRAWSAIDQVAEEHQQDLLRLISLDLGVDVVEQPVEQVQTAVDVADDVSAATLGTTRGAGT